MFKTKKALRNFIKLRKQSLAARGGTALESRFVDYRWIDYIGHQILPFSRRGILFYMPMIHEADPLSLVPFFQNHDTPFFLPRIGAAGVMEIVAWSCGKEELIPHPQYKFMQPAAEKPPQAAADFPSLWLVPGLVFDRCGGRLGRGGGYYDRLISSARQQVAAPVILGICFRWQIVARCPQEQHDQKVDGLIVDNKDLVFFPAYSLSADMCDDHSKRWDRLT